MNICLSNLHEILILGYLETSHRNSFKNFQRKGSDRQKGEPPSKRIKLHIKDNPEISEEEYEEAVQKLKKELKKWLIIAQSSI